MSFDTIPGDLLLKIFDRLPFKDCVRLRGVNQLFNEVSWRSINTMRSLKIDDDLEAYVISTQSLSSLLESCSSNLESIDATDSSCSKWLFKIMANFVYPKLEHLKITVTNDELTKKLIGQCRNLDSIYFRLSHEFAWPEDVALEKLESLEFHSYEDGGGHCVDLSPTLRPLIGNVPNLKKLTIGETKPDSFELPVEELSQLLATAPCIQELQLSYGCSISNSGNFMAFLPTWHLPNLVSLVIDLNFPSSILHGFPTSFPCLESFKSVWMSEMDDQAVVALSQLDQLRELRLSNLMMFKEKFIEMVKVLPSIAVLEIAYPSQDIEIDDQVIQALSQLQYLRELYLNFAAPTKDQIIDLVTKIPSLTVLKILGISDVYSPQTLIDFLESTAEHIHRNLEIRLFMILEYDMELEEIHAILEEVANKGRLMVGGTRY